MHKFTMPRVGVTKSTKYLKNMSVAQKVVTYDVKEHRHYPHQDCRSEYGFEQEAQLENVYLRCGF